MSTLGIIAGYAVGIYIVLNCRGIFEAVFMRFLRHRGQDSETMRKEDLVKGTLTV
jgi:hypothetical protein